MSRKPNLWKFILGVTLSTLMFIGTWATTSVPVSNAEKVNDAGNTASTRGKFGDSLPMKSICQ